MSLHLKDHTSRQTRLARLLDQDPERPGIKKAFLRLWATLENLHIEGPIHHGAIRQYFVLTPTGYQWELTLWTDRKLGEAGYTTWTADTNGNTYRTPAKSGDVRALRNYVLHVVG